ncbi:MAG: DEAD/DEAH box helicase, partial [Chlamydiia bacterium]|nr:DEAD/DEAH box helicase [Chlamydiia bacterium]
MRLWPKRWGRFRKDAEAWIAKGCIEEIQFSGKTYQVHVLDPQYERAVWAFFHLRDSGEIEDCFCACQQGNEENPCLHLVSAYACLFTKSDLPLHREFTHSIWYELCLMGMLLWDDTIVKKGKWWCSHNREFAIRCSSKGILRELFSNRPEETEETSLKFSNLSEEELDSWREGNPSESLSFELSCWGDLAKWLFLKEQHHRVQLRLIKNTSGDPLGVAFRFTDCFVRFLIPHSHWGKIIPFLTPFQGEMEENIQAVTYKNGELKIEAHKGKKRASKAADVTYEGWVFVKGEGFYPDEEHPLIAAQPLKGDKVEWALDHYRPLIRRLAKGFSIDKEAHPLHYQLSFDQEGDLHIEGYLFEPGDCLQADCFNHWIWIPKKGFYRYYGAEFPSLDWVIPRNEITSFIRKSRSWLGQQPGFNVFIGSVEAQVHFHLDTQGTLSFVKTIEKGKDNEIDFGDWIYLKGEGFFPKEQKHNPLSFSSDTAILKEHVPMFIRRHEDDLMLIPDFFASECPLEEVGIEIELIKNDGITLKPSYKYIRAVENKKVQFFDDFIYVEGMGFYELPFEFRLPEAFQEPVTLSGKRLIHFFAEEFSLIEERIVTEDSRLYPPETVSLRLRRLRKTKGGLSCYFVYRIDGEVFPVQELREALVEGKEIYFTDQCRLDLFLPRFQWLHKLPKGKKSVTLKPVDFLHLVASEEIVLSPDADQVTKKLFREISQLTYSSAPDLTGLQSTLRTYQKIGVDWLWFLYQYQLAGLLCDDMGLGKTHQAMALMAAIKNSEPTATFLIVCPTSVLYHWQEKLAQFLPMLNIFVLRTGKQLEKAMKTKSDLLLLSYGMWRKLHPDLKKRPVTLAVLDEVQIAKSNSSRIHKSLRSLSSRMILGMTGTPIENHVREIKALFDLVLPRYMPSESEFEREFVRPIQKEDDPTKKEMLMRLIKPFTLRRRKEEVLEDLPEKTEEISHCNLSQEQQRLYTAVWDEVRQKMLQEIDDRSHPVPFIHIFSILAKYKQICNHPALYLKETDDYKRYHSGKWELFLELLHEALGSEQKVVVFSQYLGMLDIIEKYLTEHNISFAGIRGSTQNRPVQINRFQNDPNCKVFVASLQAAGLGIDLTAASVVIHYDRWWNPAREN